MMNCFLCKGDMGNNTTNHVVNLENRVIIIRNVPCQKCCDCGEEYYTDEVADKLDDIISKVSALMQDVAILEYKEIA